MSDVSQGEGWWVASDGKWYSPESHPEYRPAPPSEGPVVQGPTGSDSAKGPSTHRSAVAVATARRCAEGHEMPESSVFCAVCGSGRSDGLSDFSAIHSDSRSGVAYKIGAFYGREGRLTPKVRILLTAVVGVIVVYVFAASMTAAVFAILLLLVVISIAGLVDREHFGSGRSMQTGGRSASTGQAGSLSQASVPVTSSDSPDEPSTVLSAGAHATASQCVNGHEMPESHIFCSVCGNGRSGVAGEETGQDAPASMGFVAKANEADPQEWVRTHLKPIYVVLGVIILVFGMGIVAATSGSSSSGSSSGGANTSSISYKDGYVCGQAIDGYTGAGGQVCVDSNLRSDSANCNADTNLTNPNGTLWNGDDPVEWVAGCLQGASDAANQANHPGA